MDLCRCQNKQCPKKERCLRFYIPDDNASRVVYGIFDHQNCPYFIEKQVNQ